MAGLRTGKIDDLDSLPYDEAQEMKKTNPAIMQIPIPVANTNVIEERNDLKPFNDLRVREALQMAIDLPTIAQTYYYGTTDLSPSTLTSNYMKGWGYPYSQWPQDLKAQYAYNPSAAKQLLAAAGYPNGFNTDCVADAATDLNLLQIVKSYFSTIGVNMDIRVMDSASFSSFVVSNHKQDALADRAVGSGALGLQYYPLRQITRFETGYPTNTVMVNDPVYNAFCNSAVAATSTADLQKIMIDANQYVAQQHFVVSLLQQMQFCLYQPWLKGYNGQRNALSGSSGPQLLFFYGARFWIDQNLKKSMGY